MISFPKMRRAIAAEGFGVVPVTASFGISSLKASTRSVSELIEMADEALYVSKDQGRDRVTHWDEIER